LEEEEERVTLVVIIGVLRLEEEEGVKIGGILHANIFF